MKLTLYGYTVQLVSAAARYRALKATNDATGMGGRGVVTARRTLERAARRYMRCHLGLPSRRRLDDKPVERLLVDCGFDRDEFPKVLEPPQ